MHFVAVDDDPSRPDLGRTHKEVWINLADPSRKRIVETVRGRVVVQVVFVGRSKTFSQTGWKDDPKTLILRGPADSGPGVQSGNEPMQAYRRWLEQGTVVADDVTTYRGRPAYRLVIEYKPPYKLVGNVWTGERLRVRRRPAHVFPARVDLA